MPPYRYDTPANPYALSIAELLQQRGAIEAARAQQVGQAQARATEQSGQAWGQAAQSIWQTVAAIPQQIQQQKRAGLQDQALGLQLSEQKRGVQARSALGQVIGSTPHIDDSGISLYDIPAITSKLESMGFADHVGDVATQLKGVNDSFRQEQQAKLATVQRGAQALLQAGSDPELTSNFIDLLEKNHSWPGAQLDTFRQVIQKDPTKTAAILQQFAGPAKPEVLGKDAVAIDPNTRQVVASNTVTEPNKGDYTINGQRFHADGTPIGTAVPQQAPPKSLQSENVLLDGKPAKVNFHPDTGKYTNAAGEDVSARVKPIPSAASISINAGTLTDAAKRQAAQKYLDSGVLPPGQGAAGVIQRTEIMNLAAEMDPQAALARNTAIFKADSANLTKLETTEGTLSAFEKTAGKNLDQFLTLADKIPDTGVPWLNTPVRLLNEKAVGSANIAAINAARDVALREIARVTNDPKLSGALTDSARAEVLGLSPKDATLKQIKAVAKVLKQDMANVHAGVNEQIATVKAGIGSNPNATVAAAIPANVTMALKGAGPGRHTLSDGSTWLVDASGAITKAGP